MFMLFRTEEVSIFQEGRDIGKKKTFVPPPRFFNIDEARYYFAPIPIYTEIEFYVIKS